MTSDRFKSFPKSSVQFLRDLEANNTRDWFNANKAVYESALKAPAKAFADSMSEDLEELTGAAHAAKIFRIHRDLRFSKDKRPYNTHLHISFTPDMDLPAPPRWFFALETDRLVFGAGVFGFEKAPLEAFRERVSGPEGMKLEALLKTLLAKDARLGDPELKRVPAGYPKDHPRANLLRHKGLTAWTDIANPATASKPQFMKTCGKEFSRLKPLFDWLADDR